MAGRKPTELELLIKTTGVEKLRGLTGSLKNLKNQTLITSSSTQKLLTSLKSQSITAQKSINGTRALASSYRQLAANVDFTSKEFREATSEAARLDAQLRKMQATANKGMRKGGFGGFAKTAGAVGAAGIFGGFEGLAGAAIGGILGGGVGGAVAGGIVGTQVGQLTDQISGITSYSAALERQRKALKLVIDDFGKYTKSQQFLLKTSKSLAIPQDVITRQFTSLTASVVGAGLSVDDAQKAFLAISSSIRGTGGNLEDMKAALRATSQVFSKGKVSAEELRQQLGERLPGAFTLFADSMDKTPAELDKALEKGSVTLQDFMKFVEKLTDEYGENAKILAQAPESAGDRLQTSLSELKDNVGRLLKPIGAAFQDAANTSVKALNRITVGIENLTLQSLTKSIEKRTQNIEELAEKTSKAFEELRYAAGGRSRIIVQDIFTDVDGNTIIRDRLLEGQEAIDIARQRYEAAKTAQDENLTNLIKDKKRRDEILARNMQPVVIAGMLFHPITYQYLGQADGSSDPSKGSVNGTNKLIEGLTQGANSYLQSIKSVTDSVKTAVENAFQGMEDALVNFVTTGKLKFSDLTRSILADMTRIVIQQTIMAPITGFFKGLFNAKGNAFDQGLVTKYAQGGIVTQPTLFKYGSGGSGNFGLMGEAGAEAILPLKRGRSGNLGVEASGGATNIVVNVDASGSSVEGDEADGKSLGLALSAAIESELIKQKRPGGLLA
nr:phage-related minor tail protein [uncultured Mediterranean phage uvMED]